MYCREWVGTVTFIKWPHHIDRVFKPYDFMGFDKLIVMIIKKKKRKKDGGEKVRERKKKEEERRKRKNDNIEEK